MMTDLPAALGSQFGTSAVSVAAALAILVIVAPLAIGEKSALATTLELAPFRYVGKVSLSAYLWHFPVMLMLGRLGVMAGVLAEFDPRLDSVRTMALPISTIELVGRFGHFRLVDVPRGSAGYLVGACSVNDVAGSLLPKTAGCR